MLGTVARPLARVSRSTHRSFVSTVLLTKSYESEPVTKLKQELKARGLSQTGNKATLISRIQDDDKNRTLEAISSRKASTAPTPSTPNPPPAATPPPAEPTPPVTETVTPGIPPVEQPTALFTSEFLNVRIPDTYQPPKAPTVQVPFVPDLWDSSSKQNVQTPAPEEPKIVLVAGSGTHPEGGPAHNTMEYSEVPEPTTPKPQQPKVSAQNEGGFFTDLLGDVKFLPESSVEQPQQPQSRNHKSRPLNQEERKGLWILFGLLGGSTAGGYFITRD